MYLLNCCFQYLNFKCKVKNGYLTSRNSYSRKHTNDIHLICQKFHIRFSKICRILDIKIVLQKKRGITKNLIEL